MRRLPKAALVLAAIAVLGGLAWWLAHRGGTSSESPADAGDKAESDAVAQVRVVPALRKTITEKIVSYGTVVAQQAKVHSVSAVFEVRVSHILVAPGQFVHEGDPLLEIEPSAAVQLQFQQARNAADAAQKDLKQTEDRFNLKLATNQDLGAAQKAARDAALQIDSLRKQGVGSNSHILADMTGVISKVDAQDGQVIPPGGPLVEIVAEDEIEVKLGVEAADLPRLTVGQQIALFPVDNPAAGEVQGTVRLLTRRVDPITRLVDVYVALPAKTKLLLDGYVRGEISRSSEDALVVPASALLPSEAGYSLFTVRDGHAVAHTVRTGVENDLEAEVINGGLKEGDVVVVAGNYELEDGMTVEMQPK